ncbi:MAG: prepilin-type N-terminal cleavage/methylation domain-containing protein [Kiritimatiellia bacterium]
MITRTLKSPTIHARSGSGFTLVEMLVVITILILLLAILVPAVDKAKAIAQRRVCASQIRQITTALVSYATDHQGEYPQYQYQAESYPMGFRWGLQRSTFHPDYISDRRVFYCPADMARSFNSRAKRSFPHFGIRRPPGLQEINISYVYFFGRRHSAPSWTDTRNRRGGFQYVYQNVHPAQETMIADTMRLKEAGDSRFYREIHSEAYWNHYGGTLQKSGGHLGYGDGHVRWWSGADHFPVEWPRWAQRMNGARDHVFVKENPYVPEE